MKRLLILLPLVAGLGSSPPAGAVPIPFQQRTVDITVREQPIANFLQDLFGTIGVPVSVSPSVKGAVNGHFDGPAEKVYRNIGRAFNLVEYYDGAVLYVYAPQDMVTRTLPVSGGASARMTRAVGELGMTDERNKVRATTEGTLVATGTRRFVEQVEEMARAQPPDPRNAPQAAGFRIFYLRYAWAQDVTMNFGGRQVLLPGVASTVRALMTGNARSQVAAASYEQPARSTQPHLGGQGLARQGGGLGTLGINDPSPQTPSGPALVAAYGSGGQPGMAPVASASLSPAGSPGQPPSVLGDAQQVRVEADARLNAVIVRDAPERMPQYEQLVAALDVEPQEVEIEATIIDVNTDRMRELGVNWRYSKGRSSLLFGRGDESDLKLTPTTPAGDITPMGAGGFVSAVLGNANQFIARINALQDQGAAKVVSSPQVLTLSNVEAVFDNSQTFYVRVAGRDQVDLFNVAAGTTLRVTPHVFKDRNEVRIKMLVGIEDGSLSSRVVDTLPVVDRSSINTQAMIFEGESLLVGGITRDSKSEDVSQVPLLGDLPVVGGLFRNKRTSTSRVERMFLITPRLASSGHRSTPAPLQAPAASPEPLLAPGPVPVSLPEKPLQVQDRRGARAAYERGENYEVQVSVPQDGYLYCYLIDGQRRLNQFFPNPAHRSAAVQGGSVMQFPGPFGFRLVASRQSGREIVACASTDKDLGFSPLPAAAVRDGDALRAEFDRVAGGALVRAAAFEVRVP